LQALLGTVFLVESFPSLAVGYFSVRESRQCADLQRAQISGSTLVRVTHTAPQRLQVHS